MAGQAATTVMPYKGLGVFDGANFCGLRSFKLNQKVWKGLPWLLYNITVPANKQLEQLLRLQQINIMNNSALY